MWHCIRCNETVDDNLACCWNCGADRDGVADPDFVHADLMPAPYAAERQRTARQFRLRSLLISITCLCVVFAVLRTVVAPIYVFVVCYFVLLPLAILHSYAGLYGLLLALIRWHGAPKK